MAIDEDTRATIVRLHRAEGWTVGAIARHCGVHHSTVTRTLRGAGQERRPRRALIDEFIPFIAKQFEEFPDLPASALHRQVVERGYRGGEDHFRHALRARGLRPVKRPEPALRLRFLPAEQAQVDWAEFGTVRIGRAVRKLMGLLVTLSYSRQTFLSLFHDARTPSFLQGHVEAFEAFGGVPRELLYDNLKSAVIARRGAAVTFHPRLLALAGHYAFRPAAAWPRSPQEKGYESYCTPLRRSGRIWRFRRGLRHVLYRLWLRKSCPGVWIARGGGVTAMAGPVPESAGRVRSRRLWRCIATGSAVAPITVSRESRIAAAWAGLCRDRAPVCSPSLRGA